MSKPIPVHLGAKAIGEAWLEDSSLERWFPITAEHLATLEAQRDQLRATLERAVNDELGDSWRDAARAILSKTKTP